jgi:DNA-binding LytR/AlgR family response regulator
MKIFIVEDELFHLEDLKITLEELDHECVGETDDPFEAQELLATVEADVALLDLHLHGKLAGIKLAKRIKTLYGIPIIFTSSDINYEIIKAAVDCNPIAYLTKPINKNDLRAALIMAAKQEPEDDEYLKKEQDTLFIKNGNKLQRVNISDVCYAFTDTKNYCTLVTIAGNKYSLRSSISGLIRTLSKDNFLQTHRAYIINEDHINAINEADHSVEINGESIPIGRSFKQEVYKRLNII